MPSFSFVFKTSKFVLLWLIILHGLAALIVLYLPLFWFIKIIFGFGIGLSFFYYAKCNAWLAAPRSLRVLIYQQGLWWAQCNAGELRLVKICPQTVILGRCIFLCLQQAKGRTLSQWVLARDYAIVDFKQLARAIRLD